jgi:hypothetical protein
MENTTMTMTTRLTFLAMAVFVTVACFALLVTAKRQEMMLNELLKRSDNRQDTLVLINPETRSQAGSYRNGREK